ncbi:MAG TPA: ECF-type sigma factor [Gemmataceae bacterium]|nr:ECF-type sigma factor [Gemmataceae bacterium]
MTTLLGLASAGDINARNDLYETMYPELRRLASSYMRRERRGHTLQTTALISEVFLRLTRNEAATPKDRNHFMKIAANEMRRILVDHARRHTAKKRGGGHKVSLEEAGTAGRVVPPSEDLLAVDEALGVLAERAPQEVEFIELRHFLGFSIEEAAGILDISKHEASELWERARKHLYKMLA